MRSVPRINGDISERLPAIEGLPPDLIDMPEACPFAPRCPFVMSAAGTNAHSCVSLVKITASRASRTCESEGSIRKVSSDNLVAVRDLQVHFRVRPSLLTGRGGGRIRAVDGVSPRPGGAAGVPDSGRTGLGPGCVHPASDYQSAGGSSPGVQPLPSVHSSQAGC